jgi:cytoskeleton protein RodZ
MVAAALKVPPQKLLALEADDIDSLPDPVFARALASSVCRALRIDPAPVLAKLPSSQRTPLAVADRTLKTHISSGAPRWNNGRSSGLPSRALLTVVVLLLIGAAALFWLPQSVFDRIGASVSRLTARSATGSTTESPAAEQGSGEPSMVAETVPVPAQAPTTAATVPSGAVPLATANDSAVVAPAAPAAAPAAAAASGSSQQLVFVAREECWITVTEAGGKQLLRRSLRAGETVGLSGALPLSVVVGRASVVDVQVRGKPYDLKAVTRGGGVARFEVTS